jgi:hypothetical protein
MEYVVFEDLQSKNYIINPEDTPVKIHKVTCPRYVNRKVEAPTVRWSKPFDTLEKAENFAKKLGKPWKRARCLQ